jgi:hypothetical protein
MSSMHDNDPSMVELSEEELSSVMGVGDGNLGLTPTLTPTIIAFSKEEAASLKLDVNLSFSAYKKTSLLVIGSPLAMVKQVRPVVW